MFRETVKWLRKLHPNIPFGVRRCKTPADRNGDCKWHGDRFILRVSRDIPEYMQIDVLIHEMAHALTWGREEQDHGPIWGRRYARLYRAWERDWDKPAE
jgi:hypothetical protein